MVTLNPVKDNVIVHIQLLNEIVASRLNNHLNAKLHFDIIGNADRADCWLYRNILLDEVCDKCGITPWGVRAT